MVELVVAVGLAVVERLDDDDKLGFENIDDDGYYYCQQLMRAVVLLVDLVWINYPVDKAIEKRKKKYRHFLFLLWRKKPSLEYLPKHIVHQALMGKDSLAAEVVVVAVVVKHELEIYIVFVHLVVELK
jgi:hypothetical protein